MKLYAANSKSSLPPARISVAKYSLLQRRCACGQHTIGGGQCEECRKKGMTLQRHSVNQTEPTVAPPIVDEVLRSPGEPLDAATRAFFEPRFGHDFSRVRVHTDARAAESARAVNALAYTVGRDVVFGARQYTPRTSDGRGLLAHELTHVVQQRDQLPTLDRSLALSSADNPLEQEANRVADTLGRDVVFGAGQCPPWYLAHEPMRMGRQGDVAVSGYGANSVTVQRRDAVPLRRPPFDDQPAELRSVLDASFAERKFGCPGGVDAADCFNRLDADARFVLTALYRRLSGFGLWDHVLYIRGIWTSGVGGAQFTVKDNLALLSSLLSSPRFCVDTAAGGMLHPGTTSVREISTGDSLHLSLGSANTVSAHIDAISPAAGRQPGGLCNYDPTRTAAHIGREVVPLAIPGLQIFPEPRPTFGLPEREPPPPEFIRFEFRFSGL